VGIEILTTLSEQDFPKSESTTGLGNTFEQVDLFYGVSPVGKLSVINALKNDGHFVTMLGDGVNDVLAIRSANLGIAMGGGSTAARSVADIVLVNNEFDVLPEVLCEARSIIYNLRRVAKIFLVKSAYALVILVSMSIARLWFPFTPPQIAILGAFTLFIPTTAIVLTGHTKSSITKSDFTKDVISFSITYGIVIGLTGFITALISTRVLGFSEEVARTVLLTVLIMLGLMNVYWVNYSEVGKTKKGKSLKMGFFVIAVYVFLYAAIMYLPTISKFYDIFPLTTSQWLIAILFSMLGALSGMVVAFFHGRRNYKPSHE
jgi:magnesium-transporting ATPase (P-type)